MRCTSRKFTQEFGNSHIVIGERLVSTIVEKIMNRRLDTYNGRVISLSLLGMVLALIYSSAYAGRIFGDEKLGIDLLQIADPEKNTLEIISRVSQ